MPLGQLLFLTSRLVVIVNAHHVNTGGCGKGWFEFEDNCYILTIQKNHAYWYQDMC